MATGGSSFLNKLSFDKLGGYIFFGLVAVLLGQIWGVEYYLTADGPCHLYNARVLADMATGENQELFSAFYSVNAHLEPNWFSHFVLGLLLLVFKPLIAEKLFLTAYVVLFGIGARRLAFAIDKRNAWIAILALPLMYTASFQMGFYNYSWSWVFYMIVVAYWLRNGESDKWMATAGQSVLLIVLFFCHPIGYLMAGLTITTLLLLKILAPGGRPARWNIVRNTAVAFIPSAALLANYAFRKNLTPTPNPDGFDKLIIDFIELRSLIVLSQKETFWALCCALLVGLLVVRAVIKRIRLKSQYPGDGFLIVFVFTVLMYFFQPGGLAGAGILSFRLQFVPYLVAVFWLASLVYGNRMKVIITLIAFVSAASVTFTRLQIVKAADHAVGEYVSVGDQIEPGSVVLPLSFAHNGIRPNGDQVSGRIWLFVHAADYMAASKPLIMLDNYEANTGNFPLLWEPTRNPYSHLSTGDGLEAEPPGVDIDGYEKVAGTYIDYVVTWGLEQTDQDHPNTKSIVRELSRNYELVHRSENALAHLYRRRAQD